MAQHVISAITNSPSLSWDSGDDIPLASRILHKFTEPVMLNVALVDATKKIAKLPQPDKPINMGNDEEVFQAFVNKLCHVCDSDKGGSTNTSFLILQNDHTEVHYWFASNRRSQEALESTAFFVRHLFRRIAQGSSQLDQQDALRKNLLSDVALFNRNRITVYLNTLQTQLRECSERGEEEGTFQGQSLATELRLVHESISNSNGLTDTTRNYTQKFENVIRVLVQLDQSKAGKVLAEKAFQSRMPGVRSAESWAGLFHTVKRLLAYPQSVKFLLLANSKWPVLFCRPRLSFVRSSRSIPKPIRNKSLTAEGIVGRMTRKPKQIQIYQDFVKTLQLFDLDERIENEYHKQSFDPIVHSELLLFNKAISVDGLDPSRYFNSWMYIGSSKPTCKLCNYYFEEQRSEMKHRPCHGNWYPSWRFPDVFSSQGILAVEARQIMVDRVLQRVRKDAFDLVRKKIPVIYKEDDSNTFTAAVTLEDRWTLASSTRELDDVASSMGRLGIDRPRRYNNTDEDHEDENSEDGGAQL